jgi:superfamily II DNA or RNA helicase
MDEFKINQLLGKCNTFNDVYFITKKLSNDEKGYLFERITFYLFKLSPLLNNHDELWMYDDIPAKVKKLLKLPSKDKGIDILMKKDGIYIPIQCKFRQDFDSILNWTELSTFFGLSFGMTKYMNNGYLVTNTYDLCDEVINSDKVEPIYGEFFDNLPENFFINICNMIDDKPIIKYIAKTPYKYQQECIDNAYDFFVNNKLNYVIEDEEDCENEDCEEDEIEESENKEDYEENKDDEEDEIKEDEVKDGDEDVVEEDSEEEDEEDMVEEDEEVENEIKDSEYETCAKENKHEEENKNNYDRAFIEMACGTGKSITSYCIDQKLDNVKTLILVPSLQLLSQFYSDWINQSYAENIDIRYILVGSDADVDNEVKYKSSAIILTTDKKNIENILKQYKNDKVVVISTYQSSDKLPKYQFDFGIFDEAHKTVGHLNKQFALHLKDNDVKIKKRLFMTATPKVSLKDDDEIVSMKDEHVYGKQIFKYNTGQAINDKKLVDYQIVSIYAENKDVEQDIKKNKLISYKKEFTDEEANYLGSIIIILKKIHDGSCNHMITYHNKVSRTKKFAKYLTLINQLLYPKEDIFVDSLDGALSMGKRKKIIDEYVKSSKGILCSARVLNEGVNIPIVDSECFVDSRFSTIDIVQCIGRALRLHNGKQIAKIIVPTFVDDMNDIDQCIYGNILRILKSLRTTDDGVTEYFAVKDNIKKNGRKLLIRENYIVDEKKNIEIDLEEWNNELKERIWKYIDPFMAMYEKVKEWIEKNGRIPSYSSKNIKEKQLGKWCDHKRANKKKNKLSEDKIKKLQDIPYWYWGKDIIGGRLSFDERYEKLKEYIEKNDKLPSSTSKDKYEKHLGEWCVSRRKNKKENKLSKERKNKLDNLPFWYWEQADPFMDTYENLKKWVEINNKLPSQKSKNREEKLLGSWCSSKKIYKKRGKLSDDKIKKLEYIDGWQWGENHIKKIKSFDEQYEKIKEYVKKNGKLPSLTSKNKEENQLGSWCASRRRDKKKGKLSEDKIKLCEKVDGWYWNKDVVKKKSLFDEQYEKVKEWIEKNSRIPISGSKNEEEKQLGKWCDHKKEDKKKNKLSEDRIKKLEELPYWCWGYKDPFDEQYEKVKEWIEKNNRIPSTKSKNEEEKQFGKWCGYKRTDKRKNKLSDDKIKKLDELPFWYWDK